MLSDSSPTTQLVLKTVAALASRSGISREELLIALSPHHGEAHAILERAFYERPDLLESINSTIRIRAALVADWLKRCLLYTSRCV